MIYSYWLGASRALDISIVEIFHKNKFLYKFIYYAYQYSSRKTVKLTEVNPIEHTEREMQSSLGNKMKVESIPLEVQYKSRANNRNIHRKTQKVK